MLKTYANGLSTLKLEKLLSYKKIKNDQYDLVVFLFRLALFKDSSSVNKKIIKIKFGILLVYNLYVI